MKLWSCFVLACVMSIFGAKVNAKVTEQGANHFVVKHQFASKQSASEVYNMFTQVNKWWEPDHSFEGKAENLYFDFDKQRCYCESVSNGGFVEHLAVIHVQPMKKVVFSGGLGPLQDHAVSGKLIWTFTPEDTGTKVELEYRVYGHITGGMGEWPQAVDFVLGTQIKRLAKLLP